MTRSSSLSSIGLFYGSSTCYTEIAAEKIRDYFASEKLPSEVVLHNIAETGLAAIVNFPCLILGIPTWDYGELQEDWDRLWDEIDNIDFSNKVVALYGLGDQLGYPDWFQDAMGYLYHKVEERGATIIGFWPSEGYQFNSSHALTPDNKFFVGLPLDEENEFELSEQRIQQWCRQLREEMQSLIANR
jgi:flavodoxin II